MNKGLSIFKKHQRFQGGTEMVSNQADNVAKMSPQEQLFYQIAQETLRKRQLEQQLREKLDDEQGHEEEVQNHARGTSNVPLSIFKRAQHLQGGDSNFDPATWADPGPLPPPPPAEGVNVYTQYNPPPSDQTAINNLGYDPGDPRNDLTRGFGSGVPTQRGVGYAANIAGNMVFPGLGMATGPAASWITRMLQNWFGQRNVQNATQSSQQGQTTQGTGTTDSGATDVSGDPYGLSKAPPTTPTTPPNAGVGIDPTGNPAAPGQWWSPDFGRWTGYDQFGTTPGSYNLQGPGGAVGTRGLGFTGHNASGYLPTAIGFDSLGRGGGEANFGGGFGNVAGLQLRHILKGNFSNDPNPEGIGALYEMTGTHAPSAGQFQQSQQQLQNILQANPSLMSGPTGGGVRRGGSRIPLETVQTGSSDIQQNPGLRLFMAGRGLRKAKVKKPKP